MAKSNYLLIKLFKKIVISMLQFFSVFMCNSLNSKELAGKVIRQQNAKQRKCVKS